MRFFSNFNQSLAQLSFGEFVSALPEEAELLRPALELDAEFELDHEKNLFLRSGFSSPIGLKPLQDLEYHQKFFYKNSVYGQPFAKALGLKKGRPRPKVLDATAGTLKDACLMLAMGLDVLACERHPVAQALIVNALKKESHPRLEFIPGDSKKIAQERMDWDVVFFDPMYENKNEKAAPRKEMRIFREVIASDKDAKDTAKFFRSLNKRLVIKRSSKSEALIPGASMSFGKKSTLYDVYL